MAKAIHYALTGWDALTLALRDGRDIPNHERGNNLHRDQGQRIDQSVIAGKRSNREESRTVRLPSLHLPQGHRRSGNDERRVIF